MPWRWADANHQETLMLNRKSAFAMIALAVPVLAFGADALSHSDAAFLKDAAESGMYEVEGSKIALQKSTNPQVKAFAQQMIDDHTKANQDVAALASQKGVKLPDSPSVAQKAKLTTLEHWTQDGFDNHYADGVGVSAHKDAVKSFSKASTDAKDADVKALASKTLPTLQHHLDMAEKLSAATKK
jgi:putative membrane protein